MVEPDDLSACDRALGADEEKTTTDENIDALVLFADVEFDDADAVDERVAQYEALFNGS